MIQSNAFLLHIEHERDFLVSSTRSATRHCKLRSHIGYQLERYRNFTVQKWWI